MYSKTGQINGVVKIGYMMGSAYKFTVLNVFWLRQIVVTNFKILKKEV